MINIYILKNIKINNIKKFKKFIKKIVYFENKNIYIINYIFCSNKYILHLNRKYLKKKYYTDTITFNYNFKNKIFGDIFISVDQIYYNSIYWNIKYSIEIKRVIIHSLLHLLGYNDNNIINKNNMVKKENYYLKLSNNIKFKYEKI
ncbi:MAG: rRNA maturation RNase YbeY [Candidatus Shikimatogenerans bostrichidophilus]|nr:MAG: rRNA maturation RNase YbeY [Candidatus Shikimatogenerans bostrichidophilus]